MRRDVESLYSDRFGTFCSEQGLPALRSRLDLKVLTDFGVVIIMWFYDAAVQHDNLPIL